MVKGKISNLVEVASVNWRIKHCYSTDLKQDVKKWTTQTHAASLLCGFCKKEPYITGFNLNDNEIKCCLCGEINEIKNPAN